MQNDDHRAKILHFPEIKKEEDLKTQLPEEDLKESLGNIESDMVKRLDSEPLQRKTKDERPDSDVL